MKSAETQSTWLWVEFLVVVPGVVLSIIWINGHQKRVDLRESYAYQLSK